MVPADIPPVCKVPECRLGSSIMAKQGDTMRYMLTCRHHWYGQIPNTKVKSN